jgi:hypothetical protein
MSKSDRVWLSCPNCKEGFVHCVDNSGKNAGALVGAATGATLGSKLGLGGLIAGAATGTKLGILLGPVGMAAGVIGGGVVGLIFGKKVGDKIDKPQCPKCGIKFSVHDGMAAD